MPRYPQRYNASSMPRYVIHMHTYVIMSVLFAQSLPEYTFLTPGTRPLHTGRKRRMLTSRIVGCVQDGRRYAFRQQPQVRHPALAVAGAGRNMRISCGYACLAAATRAAVQTCRCKHRCLTRRSPRAGVLLESAAAGDGAAARRAPRAGALAYHFHSEFTRTWCSACVSCM